MLRLNPPGHERLLLSPTFAATFAGAEANAAVSLANYGVDVSFVTAFPLNAIGDAAVAELRRFGVDTRFIARQGERVGVFFLEAGSNQRPSRIVYDRAHSSIATASPADFAWAEIFADSGWFHISGVTPAISASAAELSLRAVQEAKERGITVSCDYNYRMNLWKYGKKAPEVMRELLRYVDVGIAGSVDCQHALGVQIEGAADEAEIVPGTVDHDLYCRLAERVLATFPNLRMQIITLRESRSADSNGWSACLHDRETFRRSKRYEITDIVDRVGSGDAFAGAMIYGLHVGWESQRALEFATAAGALKHSLPGDYHRVSAKEVEALVGGSGSGRVER
jgi:2-dehydro-3-deoxygluconokinase